MSFFSFAKQKINIVLHLRELQQLVAQRNQARGLFGVTLPKGFQFFFPNLDCRRFVAQFFFENAACSIEQSEFTVVFLCVSVSPAFPVNRVQVFINRIILGVDVCLTNERLLRENPLYGRVDRTIDLKPMDYYESALFYPTFSDEDKVRLYSVFGGIPYYNRLVNSQLSVRENIIELIASPDARLENEVSMYLKSEISKINNANEVFEALARGFSKYSDLLSQSHVSSSPALADVLEKLIRMVCSNFHSTRVCKLCLFLFAQFIVPYPLYQCLPNVSRELLRFACRYSIIEQPFDVDMLPL